LIINGIEIDADLFRILEHIERNGKEQRLWMSDVSGEEKDLSTLGGGEETSLQDDGKNEGPSA
jgi:hypothetical protein